jgi:hypothetical protein
VFGNGLDDIVNSIKNSSSKVEFEDGLLPKFQYSSDYSTAIKWVRSFLQHDADRFPIKDIVENYLQIQVHLEEMEGELSGYIEHRHDGWHIGVNKYEVHGRQRFTLAHELGHLLFHREMIERKTKDGGRFSEAIKLFRGEDNSKHIETEANTFAAEILMPSARLRTLWDSCSLVQLSNMFDVSLYAIEYRGRSLMLPRKKESNI